MFWPFGLDPSHLAQYVFCQNFNSSNLTTSSIVDPYASHFLNFPPTYAQFRQNISPFNNDYPLIQNHIRNIHQNHQNSNVLKSEIRQESSSSNEVKEKKQSQSSSGSIKMVRFRRRRKVKKEKNKISHNSSLRNDTKNIPKNYGKAMLAYIQKNTRELKQLLSEFDVDLMEFMMTIKNFKSKINTIHDMREMWGENQKQDKIKKCIRILSYHFMRIKCLPYIFNSRVRNYHTHIKYRKKIMEGIADPEKFTKIKEF